MFSPYFLSPLSLSILCLSMSMYSSSLFELALALIICSLLLQQPLLKQSPMDFVSLILRPPHCLKNHSCFQKSLHIHGFVLCTKPHFFQQLHKKPVTVNKSDMIHRTLTKSHPFVCYSSLPWILVKSLHWLLLNPISRFFSSLS